MVYSSEGGEVFRSSNQKYAKHWAVWASVEIARMVASGVGWSWRHVLFSDVGFWLKEQRQTAASVLLTNEP